MLLIECPWCGPREEGEFAPGGEADVRRPDPTTASDRDWAEYLYYRTNPKGLIVERWLHALGCRRWFEAVRDTVTQEIRGTYPPGGRPPKGL